MHIEPPKLRADHPDRGIHCQESIQGVMQMTIADANMKGWGTVETMNAIEEVLRNLRLAHADTDTEEVMGEMDREPSNDWPAATP